MQMLSPTKVAAYYRVSTAAQGEGDRFGLPAQREAVEAYCKAKGYSIVETYEDSGFSGATAERPALSRMLYDAKSEAFDVVVVAKWDRIARDAMLDGHIRYRLKEFGVRVESATEANGIDPISMMTQTILAAVAQYERHLISARLSNARKVKAKTGGYAGGQPPLGWRARGDGTLEIDPEGQKTLGLIRSLRDSGLSHDKLAKELNARKVPTRRGGIWRASTVYSVLNAHYPDATQRAASAAPASCASS